MPWDLPGHCLAPRQINGDTMPDDDTVLTNEYVLDEETHDWLAVDDINRVGGAAQPPEERRCGFP